MKTSSTTNDPKQTGLILEEAKNMLQLKRYHDHIVNLQGISYTLDEDAKSISSVKSSYYHYICYFSNKSNIQK